MTYDDIKELVLRERQRSNCLSECAAALEKDGLRATGEEPNAGDAGELHSTYAIRSKTTEQGGLDTCGFAETLQSLRDLPEDALVLFYGLESDERLYLVFVTEEDELLGCIRVDRREAPDINDAGEVINDPSLS